MKSVASAEIFLKPRNLTDEEVEGLAAMLRNELPTSRVSAVSRREMPPGVRAVTWWQVLEIHLRSISVEDAAAAWLLGKVLDAAYRWAKSRFKSKKATGRPQCVLIYDADGKQIGSMVLKSGRHKPVSSEEAREPEPTKKRRKRKRSNRSSGPRLPGKKRRSRKGR